MTRWEHQKISIQSYVESTEANVLTAMGAQGWELVTVLAEHGGYRLYFKRPLPSDEKEWVK
jgi:hypothetical protein